LWGSHYSRSKVTWPELQRIMKKRKSCMNATCVLENKNPSCCCDGPTVPPISDSQCPRLSVAKR